MNFLSLLYLTKENSDIQIGAFNEEVKRKKLNYIQKEHILKGMEFHKLVNDFQRSNVAFTKSMNRLPCKLSRYAYEIIEMYYNHFLAADWNNYASFPLETFAFETYNTLSDHKEDLTFKAGIILEYMRTQNWLIQFSSINGIHRIASQRLNAFPQHNAVVLALEYFIDHYKDFKTDFDEFYPQLLNYSKIKFQELTTKDVVVY